MTTIEKSVRLGDHCLKIGSGATPRGGDKVYLAAGISFIRSQNVYNEGFNTDGLVHISPMHAKQLDGVTVEPGDILLNITGDSVARCCLVPKEVLPARVNQHVAIVRPDPEFIDARFLRYWMVSAPAQAKLHKLAGAGATRNALTKGMIQDLDVPCPDIDEQREIADILSSFDDKIELNRRVNRTLEAMGRAVFQSWFVDFDPVLDNALRAGNPVPEEFADRAAQRAAFLNGNAPAKPGATLSPEHAALFPSRFQDSPLGPIPEGWKAGTVGDVAVQAKRGAAVRDIDPDTPYIALDDMPRKSLAITSWKTADDVGSGKSRFQRGEILFGKLRPYFHKVGIAPVDGVCSTDILVLRPKSPEWGAFVALIASSEALVAHTTASSDGTKMPRTNWHDIAVFPTVVPPSNVAKAFESLLAPSLLSIVNNVHEARALAATRDALLPQLLSGELSVEAAR